MFAAPIVSRYFGRGRQLGETQNGEHGFGVIDQRLEDIYARPDCGVPECWRLASCIKKAATKKGVTSG